MIALLLTLACSSSSAPETRTPVEPEPSGLSECAVCGMVVREQPAPRGQVLRHDGTHEHACSIGDLRALISMPSPHGAVEQAWVEVLPPEVSLEELGTAQLPWVQAEDAWYVGGIERPLVMGVPALSYATAEQAAAAATSTGGHRTSWELLLATPFSQDAPALSPAGRP